MDLQDIYRSHPKLLIGTLAAFLAVIVVVIVLTFSGGRGAPQPNGQAPSHRPGSPAASSVTVPNPTYHPSYSHHFSETSFDQRFQGEVDASGSTIAAIEAVSPAPPGWTHAFPRVPTRVTANDLTYLAAFLQELLDRNYPTQPRGDLERWVSAEAAAELLPGEPRAAAVRALYADLFAPHEVGETNDPVPSAGVWRQDARLGVTQRAYGIDVTQNAQWSSFVSQGLTSVDPLLRVDNGTGTLAITTDGRTVTRHFSAQILVASALHHPGYGVANVDVWRAS